MSEMGQKLKSWRSEVMSALAGAADLFDAPPALAFAFVH
jgi:hypothetical protein